ncbi:hypothetical protein N0V93_002027 [Gnomoniopsis smithogilvyi]|uniref:Rhodopsin domain-containing protein n=1 Tax=Gnomoniopsis smithogilvyi TaxID=1191159 RepID=A0A9W9D363_9PEZI|nr:hypothetical protein N0V93_002027 [Gnomoniopsis smithogilvyi]
MHGTISCTESFRNLSAAIVYTMSLSSAELEALLASPAMEAPEGVTPDFDNPPNQNALAWFVTTFCMVIATACLLVRLYSRVWQQGKFRHIEALMVCGYGAYWATAYAGYSMIFTPGYYVHQWNLHNRDLIQPLWLILIYGCAYSVVLPCLKVAILLDWCEIFVVADKKQSVIWWGSVIIGTLQVVWGIACVILLNMQCVPHQAIWEFYLPSKCYNLPTVMLTSASVQVFSDVVMAMLPQKVIWGLNMNLQRRIGIAIIFSVGLLACIAASVRLSTTVTFAGSQDQMYFIGPLLFWACAEMTCGFFILSVPCLPKLLAESITSPRVKRFLGLTVESHANKSPNPSGTFGFRPRKKAKISNNMMSDPYYEMDDVTIKACDSEEHLRKQHEYPTSEQHAGVRVTRTTEVVVTEAQPGIVRNGVHPWSPADA